MANNRGKINSEEIKKRLVNLNLLSIALPKLERPIFILSAPRAGSSLLYKILSHSPTVWTIGKESHEIFEKILKLHPANRGYHSNALGVEDADLSTAITVKINFLKQLKNRERQPLLNRVSTARMLEKTPKNALRIPFLNEIFPDAKFIYLYRHPHENISSIVAAWQSQKCVTYPQLPHWNYGLYWSMLLIPNWRELRHKPLIDIATAQWKIANQEIINNLELLDKKRWCAISYSDLIAHPQTEIQRLCDFAEIEWKNNLRAGKLPLTNSTITPPHPDKWRQHEEDLIRVLPQIKDTLNKIKEVTQLYTELP